MEVKNSRGIAMKLICCTALVVFGQAIAFCQALPKPTSGALLSIDGTAGSTPVHIKLYDSQIHSSTNTSSMQVGTAQVVPVATVANGGNCTSNDQVATDAYVLQGGAPTGCDPGDPFEITDNNPNSPHQAYGHADLSGFHIETHYLCGGSCTGIPTAQQPVCNTSGSICAAPDTGFLTVTNNTGSTFTGTISLTGTSGCGAASDSSNAGLANLGSVTLALGTESSNCGGYNQAQTLAITNTATSVAKFGKDDYQITPSTANTGDTLDVLPVPVPAGPTLPLTSSLVFSPGSMFPNLKCIPYADFSAPGNPVCVELQLHPHGTDSGNYIYTAQNDFNIDANSLPNGIGGPSFLGHHDNDCPDSGFDINFFLSYTAPSPTFGDPLKGSGGGTGSCWVAAFDPNAGAVSAGAMVGFFGFQSPVVDTKINVVKAGSSVPLKWQQFAGDGTPETNLSWCSASTQPTGSVCTLADTTTVPAPWVWLGTMPIGCPSDTVNTGTDTALAPGKSAFQANTPSPGSYQFNWQTVPKSTGCVALVLQYDTGLQVFQAIFKYSKT